MLVLPLCLLRLRRFRTKAKKQFCREAEEKEQKKIGGLKIFDKNMEKPKTQENLMSPDAINIWLKKKRDIEENKEEIKTRVKETRKKMKIQHKICKSLKKNLMELKKKKIVMKREDREQEIERELLLNWIRMWQKNKMEEDETKKKEEDERKKKIKQRRRLSKEQRRKKI